MNMRGTKRSLMCVKVPLAVVVLLVGCDPRESSSVKEEGARTDIASLIEELCGQNWPMVRAAAMRLEAWEEDAIEPLLAVCARDERVPLVETADLIYPGARQLVGHGLVVDYDLNWLVARAGWVLENITFMEFGFREGLIDHDELLERFSKGDSNWVPEIPREEVQARRQQRLDACERARQWWSSVKSFWTRYAGLRDALACSEPRRNSSALRWLRKAEDGSMEVAKATYEREIIPLLKRLSLSPDRDVSVQASLLLESPPAVMKE